MGNRWRNYSIIPDSEISTLQQLLRFSPPGDVIVAGSYKGGDVMAFQEVEPGRFYVVIDSFEGLADPTTKDEGTVHQRGEFSCGGLDRYLENFKVAGYRVPDEIHQLFIDENSLKKVPLHPISFLWLDLDHYQPTMDCFNYFRDFVVPGGLIVTHDYKWKDCPGIERFVIDSGLEWKSEERVAYWRKEVNPA